MIIEYITMKEKGWVVEFYFQDVKIFELNFYLIAKVAKNWSVLKGKIKSAKVEADLETEEGVAEVEIYEVDQFIKAYTNLQYKYTKQIRNYIKGSKSWEAFAKATVTAKKYKLDAATYIGFIKKNYSERNKSEKVILPYPMQLQGDYAEQVIMDELAKRTDYIDPELKAKKLAIANQRIPLAKDDHYLDCRENLKHKGYTIEDIIYLETRQIQIYGAPKEWIKEFRDKLKDL